MSEPRDQVLGGSNKLLTTTQAAAYLGIAPRTLRLKRKAWGLPVVRLGREMQFRERDLETLIMKRTETP